MKVAAAVLALATAVATAEPAGQLQQFVDSVFEQYLPPQATWPEVQACRAKCNGAEDCIAACPTYHCPFARISQHCGELNSTLTAAKACHMACGHHNFACHLKCPMAKPTSVQELQKFASAMSCHAQCGHDKACHKQSCSCPWAERQALCGKLLEAVQCHRTGGTHATCKLDEETKGLLLQEPESLVQDIANHVVDQLLPLSEGQQATKEEVRNCHMKCGADGSCHRACPTGPYGIIKDHCEAMDVARSCHQSCEKKKCPFGKMKCHYTCPASMPSSVRELKDLADHVACHTECGSSKTCHAGCPMSELWVQKREQCLAYNRMKDCHMGCQGDHLCHTHCPRLDFENPAMAALAQGPGAVVKEAVTILMM